MAGLPAVPSGLRKSLRTSNPSQKAIESDCKIMKMINNTNMKEVDEVETGDKSELISMSQPVEMESKLLDLSVTLEKESEDFNGDDLFTSTQKGMGDAEVCETCSA